MWQPTQEILAAAFDHAEACAPMESCGLVIGGKYFPVKNTSEMTGHFVMDMREAMRLKQEEGAIEAIVHSHVYQRPIASIADLASCEKHGVPWLIVSHPLRMHHVIEPSGFVAPLVGRPWAWGTLDCFGLVRDAYKQMAGIHIPDFERNWGWWEKGDNLIEPQFESAGFKALAHDADWRPLDVIGCQIRCPVVNHVGVWLAGDVILHQLAGHNSVKQAFGGFFRDTAKLHLRHVDLFDSAARIDDSVLREQGGNMP